MRRCLAKCQVNSQKHKRNVQMKLCDMEGRPTSYKYNLGFDRWAFTRNVFGGDDGDDDDDVDNNK